MKALILSLVIAFSSSFALACTQADATFNTHSGAYTHKDQLEEKSVDHTSGQVAGTESGSQTR